MSFLPRLTHAGAHVFVDRSVTDCGTRKRKGKAKRADVLRRERIFLVGNCRLSMMQVKSGFTDSYCFLGLYLTSSVDMATG